MKPTCKIREPTGKFLHPTSVLGEIMYIIYRFVAEANVRLLAFLYYWFLVNWNYTVLLFHL